MGSVIAERGSSALNCLDTSNSPKAWRLFTACCIFLSLILEESWLALLCVVVSVVAIGYLPVYRRSVYKSVIRQTDLNCSKGGKDYKCIQLSY